MQTESRSGVEAAIEAAGSVGALAKIAGVRSQAVSQWRRNGRIPAYRVRVLHEGLKRRVPLKVLSPELYG